MEMNDKQRAHCDQFTHQRAKANRSHCSLSAGCTMDNRASKRQQQLHASSNQPPQLKPSNHTICKQRRPQEPQGAAESNQHEARATRRVAGEQAPCSAEDEYHPATARLPHPQNKAPHVVVLRRCEDLNIRTSGFQKIEEDSQRRPMDLRRQIKQQQQQRTS